MARFGADQLDDGTFHFTSAMTEHSVTGWIRNIENKDRASQELLWRRYFQRVVRHARARMSEIQARVYDEEDAAVSALHSLFHGIQNQQFPELHDRDNLWRLLIIITNRKLTAQKRRESARISADPFSEAILNVQHICSTEPTPEMVAELMDEMEQRLELLGDEKLRRIAVMRMEGLSTAEIADRINSTSRTIRRKLERIRDIWGVAEDE